MAEDDSEEVGEMERALGKAINAWANIEGALCNVFALAVAGKDGMAARAAFCAILSFEVQLAVTSAAVKVTYRENAPILTRWRDISKRIDKLRPLRNKLAHGNIILVYGTPERAASIDFLPFHHWGAMKPSDHYDHWTAADTCLS